MTDLKDTYRHGSLTRREKFIRSGGRGKVDQEEKIYTFRPHFLASCTFAIPFPPRTIAATQNHLGWRPQANAMHILRTTMAWGKKCEGPRQAKRRSKWTGSQRRMEKVMETTRPEDLNPHARMAEKEMGRSGGLMQPPAILGPPDNHQMGGSSFVHFLLLLNFESDPNPGCHLPTIITHGRA